MITSRTADLKTDKIDGFLSFPLSITIKLFCLLIALTLALPIVAASDTDQLPHLVSELAGAKLKKISPILQELEQTGGEKVLPLFEALLAGKLYYVKADKSVVIVEGELSAESGSLKIKDALSAVAREPVSKALVKKIRVNNKLRKALRKAIARMTLFSSDVTRRESAVDNLMQDLNTEYVELLVEAQKQEKSDSVLERISLALNIFKLESTDPDERIMAINSLLDSVEPVVRNRLQAMVEKDDDGKYLETDSSIVLAANKALRNIQGKLEFYGLLERIFFGLSLGSVLLLAALGLSITFGVMGVINMAHGELLMLGAYTTYVIQLLMPDSIGLSVFVAIPAAFLVCGLVGIAIERGVIQFLKGRPLETLLATFGISLILQQSVRSIFSPLNRQVSTPEWMSGALQINPGLAITYNRLYIIIFSLIVFALLLLVMKKTALGLYVRAVSQNRDMAKAVGIRSEWVDAMTFGLGSGITGVAGVALSQLTNVGPNLGQAYIIDSFMVVVFGGVGSLWGTLVAAFSLGTFTKFMEPVTGTMLAQIFVLIFIVLFIQKRPRGLFPQQGRAAE